MKSSGARRHLASSPFQPEPELVIENFDVEDLVSHDSYGVGRVVNVEASAVTVNFGERTIRITSPYSRMTCL